MTEFSALGSISAPLVTPLAGKTNELLHASASASAENNKIEKSARDFESILLGSWLEQAEKSFATVPGTDEDEDGGEKEQFQGLAMESLGNSMTAAGGIGIARMIATQLHKADQPSPAGNGPLNQ